MKNCIFKVIGIVICLALIVSGCSKSKPIQKKQITIGIINLAPVMDAAIDGFKKGMKEFGYIEGSNIKYIYEGATMSIDALTPALERLKSANVDMIFSSTTPATIKAKECFVKTDIPVVFAPVNDPVNAGIVDSLTDPGCNVTGVKVGGFIPKGLQLMVKIAPDIKIVYVMYNPNDKSANLGLSEIEETAKRIDIQVVKQAVHSKDEIEKGIGNIPQDIDAIAILTDSMVESMAKAFAKFALERRIPSFAPSEPCARDGILMSYGMNIFKTGKQASRLADQILKGVSATKVPVETADYELVVNLKTADQIDIKIPEQILRQADKIIR